MNKIVAIMRFVVVAGYAIPDKSSAHRHILGPPEAQSRSLIPNGYETFIGPIQRNEGFSQQAEQSGWYGITLIHPDPRHLRVSGPYRPDFYRDNHAPDGTAVMFSWPFGKLGSQVTPDHTTFNLNSAVDDPYSR